MAGLLCSTSLAILSFALLGIGASGLALARLPAGPAQPFWISLGRLTLVIAAALLPPPQCVCGTGRFASTAAATGSQTLSENYLYTVEAMHDVLGHPVYALVVVLGAMLFISGAGSLQTRRIAAGAALRRVGGLLLVFGVYAPALPSVVRELMGQALPLKVAIAVALITPPASLMGMLFPLGLKAVARTGASLVPWLWAANSGCSVLGAGFCLLHMGGTS